MVRRIGRYEVQDKLEKGGQGQVFAAYDPTMRRPVAIKVLTEIREPDLVARFRSETFTTGNLQHPNIVTVYDSGEEEGRPYLVMELLEGHDLRSIIKNAPDSLSLDEKVHILVQAASGLSYAHQRQVIHRDIKPANVMLLNNHSVKLMDFGIARLNSAEMIRYTSPGLIVGTIQYMAPEQFRGVDADELTDVYSFGVMAYELISGTNPFVADDAMVIINRIANLTPPRLTQVCPNCPEALESAIERAIAKERELRIPNMQEVLFELEPLLADLRRDRATTLLEEARPLIASETWNTAQNLVRKALELDPSNRSALALRRQVQQQIQKQQLSKRVEELINEGVSYLGERRYPEAVRAVESAAKLDPENSRVNQILATAKAAAEKQKRALEFIAEARLRRDRGELEAAFQSATRAIELDTGNRDAAELCGQLQQALEQRRREDRLRKLIEDADRARRDGNYDQALGVVRAIESEFSGMPAVARLRETIEAERAEAEQRQRRQRYQDVLLSVHQLRDAGRLEEAESTLATLCQEFPEEKACANALADVRREMANQRRAREIARAQEEARSLLSAERFADAKVALNSTMARFGPDPALQSLLDQTMARIEADRRAKAIDSLRQQAQESRAHGDLARALDILRAGLRQYPEDTRLATDVQAVESEIIDQQVKARFAKELEQAKLLLDAGQFEDATVYLERCQSRYASTPELLALLSRARQGKAASDQEAAYVQQVIRDAAASPPPRRYRGALSHVEHALRSYPANALLVHEAERLRPLAAQEQAAEAVELYGLQIEDAIDARDWKNAAECLDRARREFPQSPVLDQLASRLRDARQRSEFEEFSKQVQSNLASGDLDTARFLLESEKVKHQEHPQWRSLQEATEQQQQFLRDYDEALKLFENGSFEKAERLLVPLTLRDLPDRRAALLLEKARTERGREAELAERQRQFDRDFAQAQKLAEAGQFERAEQILQSLLSRDTPDHRAARLLEQVRAERLRQAGDAEKQRQFDRDYEQAQREFEAGQFQNAEALLAPLIPRDMPDRRASLLLERVRQERQRQAEVTKLLEQTHQFVQQKEYSRADEQITKVFALSPENREAARMQQLIDSGKARFEDETLIRKAVAVGREGNVGEATRMLRAVSPESREDTGIARLLAEAEQQLARVPATPPPPLETPPRDPVVQTPPVEPGPPPPRPRWPLLAAAAIGVVLLATAGILWYRSHSQPTLTASLGPLASGEVGSLYAQPLSASGGKGAYRWTLDEGRLPPGVVIETDPPSLRGTPSESGDFAFSLKVADEGGAISRVPGLSIKVSPASGPPSTPTGKPPVDEPNTTKPLNIASSSLPDFVEGLGYSHTLSATGGKTPYRWSVGSGKLPPGIHLDSSSGQLSGTPSSGRYQFSIKVTDAANHSSERRENVSVAAKKKEPDPLSIVAPSLPNGTVGTTYSAQFNARGGVAPYRWSISGCGSLNCSVDAGTGLVKLSANSPGKYNFSVRVDDNERRPQGQSVSVVFDSAPVKAQPLVISSAGSVDGTQNSSLSSKLAASGGTPPYTFSVASGRLPSGLSLDASGALSGTPSTYGAFPITVRVTDSLKATADRALSVRVSLPSNWANTYNDVESGKFTWTGEPDASGIVTISQSQAQPGRVSGQTLPGYPVNLQVAAGEATVVSAPSLDDRFRTLKIKLASPDIRRVTVSWTLDKSRLK